MDCKVTEGDARASNASARSGHNSRAAMLCGTIVPTADDFAVMVRTLWPVKGAAALTDYCGTAERTARAYARGDREPCMSVLWMLIQSREGFRVVSYIADKAKPDWWINLQRERELAAMAVEIFQRAGVIMSPATVLPRHNSSKRLTSRCRGKGRMVAGANQVRAT